MTLNNLYCYCGSKICKDIFTLFLLALLEPKHILVILRQFLKFKCKRNLTIDAYLLCLSFLRDCNCLFIFFYHLTLIEFNGNIGKVGICCLFCYNRSIVTVYFPAFVLVQNKEENIIL